MNFYEANPDQVTLNQLISMSEDWENENSTYGYRKNDSRDIEGNRIFLAVENEQILGYLLGHRYLQKQNSSVIKESTPCFEVEELYIREAFRSRGIGRQLFVYAENKVKNEGIEFITLTTAVKNYQKIFHFYLEELGMEFWSARLFRKL